MMTSLHLKKKYASDIVLLFAFNYNLKHVLLAIHLNSFHHDLLTIFQQKSGNFFEHEGKINPQRPKLDAVIQCGGKHSVWATSPK